MAYNVALVSGNEYDPKAPRPFFQGSEGKDLVFAVGSYKSMDTGGGNDIVVSLGYGNYADLGDGDDIGIAGRATQIYGGAGNDKLFGSAQDDNLNGGAGADTLFGGDGSDFIYFDVSDPFVAGGSGKDAFVLSWSQVSPSLHLPGMRGVVRIDDFSHAEHDILNLASLNAEPGDVYSGDLFGGTLVVTEESVVMIVGVVFPDVNVAIADGSLILNYPGGIG